MRAFRICSCLLLTGALIATPGCSSPYVEKGAEVRKNIVTISNCKADPYTVRVPKGEKLTWTVDPPEPDHSYLIHFPDRKPVSSADPPTEQAQQVTGDFQCTISLGLSCKYRYDLTKDGTACPDPGVHVGPGG
jgi:hypothetical protein